MMPKYHIGSLDEKAKAMLSEGEVQENTSDEPRPVFLESRSWTKAILESKKTVSWDTRVFNFKLQHDEQELGLPTGQHLMIRLRDPVTREAIIRAYTPISEQTSKGRLEVLVKVYFDTDGRKGGRMSQALDALPMGHFVDFKGPIGKFEYLGGGACQINGKIRKVREFFMICGGSGVTPIYQVFRAVMKDSKDKTRCVVLNGNRLVEDILCRKEMDEHAQGNDEKCRIVHTLTQAPAEWSGLKGRIGSALLREHAPARHEALALICGPEGLEKAVHAALSEMGWQDDDMMFF